MRYEQFTGWAGAVVACACVAGTAQRALAAFPTVATYDEAARANAVDVDATASLAAFTADVASAHALGFGGVADFDTGSISGNNVVDIDFGPGGSAKRLRMSASANLAHHTFIAADPVFNRFEPISGSRSIGPSNFTTGSGNPDLNYSLLPFGGLFAGGAPGEAVVQVAFTLLSRNSAAFPQQVTVSAEFSDDSVASETRTLSNVTGGGDTFFHFAAPAGHYVEGFRIDSAGADGPAAAAMDDFGFVTAIVPEPLGAPLVGFALFAGASRTRRTSRHREQG